MTSRKWSSATAVAFSLIAFSGFTAGAGDTYYRWLDASGTPVNSDRPPAAGVKYDVITTNTNQTVNARTAEADTPEKLAAGSDSTRKQQSSSAQPAASEKNPEACATARKNMETLQSHARIRVPDGGGSYRFLNKEEKAQQLAHSQAAIAHYCE